MAQLAITAGTLSGRLIQCPNSPHVRPTTARVRKSVMAWMQHACNWHDGFILDCFAGSGILGLEFLSTGARGVVALEKHRTQATAISKAATTLKVSEQLLVIPQAVETVCQQNSASQWHQWQARYAASHPRVFLDRAVFTGFTGILADPPYGYTQWDLLLDKWATQGWLTPTSGWLLLESHADDGLAKTLAQLCQTHARYQHARVDEKTYGETVIHRVWWP